MAKSKNPLATIIIIALLAVLLFALNPTLADFKAWRSAQAQSQATAGTEKGTLKNAAGKLAGAVAGAMTGFVAGGFKRQDYLVCSTYSFGGKDGDLYLGVARLFIKLK
jgi:hypothetical protein